MVVSWLLSLLRVWKQVLIPILDDWLDNRDGLNLVGNEDSLSLLRIKVQYLVHSPVVKLSYFIKSNQLIIFSVIYLAKSYHEIYRSDIGGSVLLTTFVLIPKLIVLLAAITWMRSSVNTVNVLVAGRPKITNKNCVCGSRPGLGPIQYPIQRQSGVLRWGR